MRLTLFGQNVKVMHYVLAVLLETTTPTNAAIFRVEVLTKLNSDNGAVIPGTVTVAGQTRPLTKDSQGWTTLELLLETDKEYAVNADWMNDAGASWLEFLAYPLTGCGLEFFGRTASQNEWWDDGGGLFWTFTADLVSNELPARFKVESCVRFSYPECGVPADGQSKAYASYSCFDQQPTFSFVGDSLGCSVDGNGTVTAGFKAGTVTVKASTASCEAYATLTLVDVGLSKCQAKCLGCRLRAGCPGSLNNASFEFELGVGEFGESAGSLSGNIEAPSPEIFTPKPLSYSASKNFVQVLTNAAGIVRQIKTPNLLVDIFTNSASQYTLNYFRASNAVASLNDYYSTNGVPFRQFVVSNPDTNATNRLRITELRDGVSTVADYVWGNNALILTNGDGLFTEIKTISSNSTWRTEIRQIQDAAGSTNTYEQKDFQIAAWGVRLTNQILGVGIGARTNLWTWDTNGFLVKQQMWDGQWKWNFNDSRGIPTNTFSSFALQGPTTNSALCRLTSFNYDSNAVSGSGDSGIFHMERPRCITEYIYNQEVGRKYFVYLNGEEQEITCVATGAAWNASNNLVLVRKYFTNDFFLGMPFLTKRPDGTIDAFRYYLSDDYSTYRTNVVLSGHPDATGTNVDDGTKTITIIKVTGETIFKSVIDIASGITIMSESRTNFDADLRPQTIAFIDGTTETYSYDCCGLASKIDREGATITYAYDSLKREVASERSGIVSSNVYDAAGNIVLRCRIGTNGGVITLQQNAYDTAGRMTASTNAVGDVTIFAEILGATGISNTVTKLTNTSSGPRRIEARYLDGQVKAITGSLVHPVRYEYGPTNGGTFTKEIKLDSNGSDTSEWTIQFFDAAGRPYEMLYADGPFSQTFYNSAGQVRKQIDQDGVTTLYEYNGKGEPALVAIDIDRDGSITRTNDRITWTTNYVVNNGLADVYRTETRVWATNGVEDSTLITITDASVNGLTNWSTRYGVTTRTETRFMGGGVRYAKSIAPDDSFTTTRFEDGRAVAVTRTNGITQLSATTFGFDEHGRQRLIIDARNGTNMNSFDSMDRIIATITPLPSSGQASQTNGYQFDSLGRVSLVTNADGTLLYKDYFDSGELKKIYGSRTYPAEYTYDSQGRVLTMKTWQDYAENSGAATTTWNYDGYRGFMTNKVYADNTKAGYRYTPGGRLYQRIWARGVTTTYATNSAGEIASIDYSDSTPDVTYTYDRLGRRATIVDGAGTHILNYELDGRPLSETNTAGILAGLALTNRYDSFNRRTALGLSSDANALVTYGYDGASRLSSVTNGANTAAYSYVANSPLVSQIEFKQSGTTRMTTTKSYDYLNRLTLVTNALTASGSENPSFAYANNNANQRISITNACGSCWVYTYDSLGQLTSGKKYWSDGTPVLGQQFDYTFDDIGNRKTAVSGGDASGNHKRTQSYTANNLNQYTQRTVPGYLDVIGTATNNATVTVNSGSTSRKSDYYRAELEIPNSSTAVWQSITNTAVLASGTNDYVTNWTGNVFVPKSVEAFGYDADGNQTNDGRWTLIWDGENRLIQMTSLSGAPVGSSNRLTFTYDQQGRRIARATESFVSGAWSITLSNRYIYDGWNLLAELNATNNAVINTFVWGTDLSGSIQGAGGVGGLLAIGTTNVGTQFVGFDGNGNVTTLVSASSGNATANYEYDPFGNVLRTTGPMALLNPFRFSTKYTDAESGLDYYGYRFYNSTAGRWLNRDPRGERGGPNIFGYVANMPTWHIDPFGLELYLYVVDWWTVQQINLMAIREAPTSSGLTLGYTTVLDMPSLAGDRDIPEFPQGGCNCAKVKRNYEYQLIIHEYIPSDPVGKYYTESGRKTIRGHEDRRVQAISFGFEEYFAPMELEGYAATKCGTICNPKPGVAKGLLEQYLRDLQKAAFQQYFEYNWHEQGSIASENAPSNKILVEGLDGQLLDGLKTIHKVAKPPAFKMPPCPGTDCGY